VAPTSQSADRIRIAVAFSSRNSKRKKGKEPRPGAGREPLRGRAAGAWGKKKKRGKERKASSSSGCAALNLFYAQPKRMYDVGNNFRTATAALLSRPATTRGSEKENRKGRKGKKKRTFPTTSPQLLRPRDLDGPCTYLSLSPRRKGKKEKRRTARRGALRSEVRTLLADHHRCGSGPPLLMRKRGKKRKGTTATSRPRATGRGKEGEPPRPPD